MPEAGPVIIIGAPRSGTNLLRNLLTAVPGVVTFPCDEVNYLWRYRQSAEPYDTFRPETATPKITRYLHHRFDRFLQHSGGHTLVEKTCANSLRVEFVREVFPAARFVFLVRDGRDAVASAMLRWRAKLDLRYLGQKVPFVPLPDLPRYAARYLGHRVRRLFTSDGSLPTWGPRFEGLDVARRDQGVSVACALQWATCVTTARASFETTPHTLVRYEELVANPIEQLDRIATDLDLPALRDQANGETVFRTSVGGWRKKLSDEDHTAIRPFVDPVLRELGYPVDSDTVREAA